MWIENPKYFLKLTDKMFHLKTEMFQLKPVSCLLHGNHSYVPILFCAYDLVVGLHLPQCTAARDFSSDKLLFFTCSAVWWSMKPGQLNHGGGWDIQTPVPMWHCCSGMNEENSGFYFFLLCSAPPPPRNKNFLQKRRKQLIRRKHNNYTEPVIQIVRLLALVLSVAPW